MALSDELDEAFNDQIRLEFESMYVYLQMAAHFETVDLVGFASWMRLQAEEERAHAMKFFDFVIDRGSEVRLRALDAPKIDTSSPLAVVEQALEHEKTVTASIHRLYQLADGESDYASFPLLQWFISEQVEEEATVSHIVERVRRAGDDQSAILLLDNELGARTGAGS
jgi:ferritin